MTPPGERSADVTVEQESPKKLHHVWCEDIKDFFARIDECGGWPVGKTHVAFQHSEKRLCEFMDREVRDGWLTTVATSDDYYRWKLSPRALAKLKREVRDEVIAYLQGMRL